MSEKELRTGTVHSAEFKFTSKKSGWKTWEVRFDDGSKESIVVPKDVDYEFKEGDKVSYFKGPYSWVIDSNNLPSDGPEEQEESQTSTKSTTQKSDRQKKQDYWNDRENYWKAKEEYEVTIRDPKIEFQSYFRIISDIYASAIPTINRSSQPSKIADVDDIVDQAFAKAKEIYSRVNPDE